MEERISKAEIKSLIDKYGLTRVGDKIMARKISGYSKTQIRDEVVPHKAEILKYLEEEDNARLKTGSVKSSFLIQFLV